MGDLRRPLLRPARAARGVRSAARRGGAAARALARALAVAVALAVLFPTVALADTVTLAQYLQRLQQARRDLTGARGGGPMQAPLLLEARALLGQTDAIALPSGGTLRIDDSALANGLDERTASMDAAISRINARVLLVDRVGAAAIDPALADARLRDVTQQGAGGAAVSDLFDLLGRILLRFISGLRGPGLDLLQLIPALGLLGIAVILFVVATLGRALPERVRSEVLARGALAEERADPLAHLRAAEAALAGGRTREALHALYLYVIGALAAREVIRYDPALTDRELLARASAIPHAEALRALVGLYERSWFGLREPSADEARRARELALRVAP